MCFDFCVLSFGYKYPYGEDELSAVFVSLHSFFLQLGIRTFAVDLFIAPFKEKITVLKTYNTDHKRENS